MAGEAIVGFIRERSGDDPFHSRAAGGIGQEARINSVAGDDSERVWNFHEARLTMRGDFLTGDNGGNGDSEVSKRSVFSVSSW